MQGNVTSVGEISCG